jgi:hypothetical protein
MATTEAEGRSTLEEFPAVWQRIVTDPLAFFTEMPETGGLQEPAAFLAICAGIAALGHLLAFAGVPGMVASFVAQIVAAFVLAALFVLIAQHLFGGRAGYEPTFRVVAYAWAPLVVAWIPYVGRIALLYAAFLMVRGLERVHALDTTRAVLTIVLGVAALWILGLTGIAPTWI